MSLTQESLSQFTGTECYYYQPPFKSMKYTEGVKYLAQEGGAYWLLTEITIAQRLPQVKKEPFQVWSLRKIIGTNAAHLTCEDGNGKQVYVKGIDYTDFPLDEVDIWCVDNVMLLPSEY